MSQQLQLTTHLIQGILDQIEAQDPEAANPGVAAQMFETMATAGINIQMLSTSGIRISAIVDEGDAERAVGVLHDAFELDKPVT